MSKNIVIIGAGPAGLTAAYELARHGETSTIVEQDAAVGGLSRTEEYKGYLFDIGGHRFYTKVSLVEQIWLEVLGENLLTRPRLSRIYYRNQFFNYPLSAVEALRKLGLREAIRCGASFVGAKLRPRRPEEDLESWLYNRFGQRLFEIFFKTYTEKVWGMSCREIRADWAAQRIRGLSLATLLADSLTPKFLRRMNSAAIKTLIQEFHYPRLGPGMMWQAMRDLVEQRGTRIILEAPATRIRWRLGRIDSIETPKGSFPVGHLISTMPIRSFINALDPAPPEWMGPAAEAFRYRDFLTVALIVRAPRLFDDNWIYIHEPGVRVGRIQNFKNWSPAMVPDPEMSCLGMEYFCQQDDEMWSMPDAELVKLAASEIGRLGLANPALVEDGTVVRVPKAYPVYDENYQQGLELVQRFQRQVRNLQFVGRNGMHRYNNQDHSMLTGVFAARNILGSNYDLWSVNTDEEYQEEGRSVTEEELSQMALSQPRVPTRLS
jgi:protoporphyrinogen oxidase